MHLGISVVDLILLLFLLPILAALCTLMHCVDCLHSYLRRALCIFIIIKIIINSNLLVVHVSITRTVC